MDLVRQCLHSRGEPDLVYNNVRLPSKATRKKRTCDNISVGVPFFLRVTIIDMDMIVSRILSSGNELDLRCDTL